MAQRKTSGKKSRRRRSRHGLQKLLVAVVAIAIVIILGRVFIFDSIKEKAARAMAEKLIQAEISADSELAEQLHADEILDAMTDEERDTVTQIVGSHLTPSTVTEASSYITSGDTAGLKAYARDTLSDAEMEQIRELYRKYKDQLTQDPQEILDQIQRETP